MHNNSNCYCDPSWHIGITQGELVGLEHPLATFRNRDTQIEQAFTLIAKTVHKTLLNNG